MDIHNIKDHMMKLGIVGKDCKAYIKELGVTGALEYCKSGFKASVGTIAAGDVLLVPANVLIAEQVTDSSDCFGLRWAMVLSRDTSRYKVFETLAASKLTPSTHISKAIVAAAQLASVLV